ncbi:MAG TPA: PRC-barrel domain-containing protein [Alphaproteobacteria bacterium]|nr:PRC-barrel domain-containing protein [Alphaproteobacteria bacterium]
MLWSTERLRDFGVRATDGDVGTISDLLFDDRSWTVRYLVVRAGNWLTGRKVLIAPAALRSPDGGHRTVPVNLSREQVKSSPDIDADMPVNRQHEVDLHRYYGWTPYWGAPYVAGSPVPGPLADVASGAAEPSAADTGDNHLRSEKEVRGYHIGARDGSVGHVEDFLVDEDRWQIRYMVVDTSNWLPGRRVVIAADQIRDVSWTERKVFVDVARNHIENAPEFDPDQPVGRGYEERLYEHYGWRPYW